MQEYSQFQRNFRLDPLHELLHRDLLLGSDLLVVSLEGHILAQLLNDNRSVRANDQSNSTP